MFDQAAPRDTETARRALRRGSRFAGRCEAALWLVAALALGSAGWTWADAALYQRRHADTDFSLAHPTSSLGASSLGERRRVETVRPPSGTAIARLRAPRLGLEAVVAEGTSTAVLRRAIGRLPESGLPGQGDNIALAAHRDTFFRPLEGIQPGDVLVLESAAGSDSYAVEWTSVVEPDDVTVAGATGYPALTLITCYPFRYIGDAPQRFVVRARRLDPKDGSTRPAAPVVGAGAAPG